MTVLGLGCLPLLMAGERVAILPIRWWARSVLFGARWIIGVEVEFRGLEHRPSAGGLLAAKHMSMLDTIVPFLVLDAPCFVLKKELMYLPAFGWYAARTRMVAVERKDAAKALRQMARDCAERLKDGRQVVIFPEGTRSAPGADPDYKPGVAALYRDLEAPCHLMATNSGLFWSGRGNVFKPGKAVFEFLPPLPAGLKRGELMTRMKTELETASDALMQAPQ